MTVFIDKETTADIFLIWCQSVLHLKTRWRHKGTSSANPQDKHLKERLILVLPFRGTPKGRGNGPTGIFPTGKCEVLHWEWTPPCTSSDGSWPPRKQFCRKGPVSPGGQFIIKAATSPWCKKRQIYHQLYVTRTRKATLPLYSALLTLYLRCWARQGGQNKGDWDRLILVDKRWDNEHKTFLIWERSNTGTISRFQIETGDDPEQPDLLHPGLSSAETRGPSDNPSNLNCSGTLKFINF